MLENTHHARRRGRWRSPREHSRTPTLRPLSHPAFAARTSGNLLFIASLNASLSAAVICSSGRSRLAVHAVHREQILVHRPFTGLGRTPSRRLAGSRWRSPSPAGFRRHRRMTGQSSARCVVRQRTGSARRTSERLQRAAEADEARCAHTDAASDPAEPQEQHLHALRDDDVASERERQEQEVEGRQRHEAEIGAERCERQRDPERHDARAHRGDVER
jgi:hypothetical protein